jgi:hypothetical protein
VITLGRAASALLLLVALADMTGAQVLYGTMTGNVTDATGSVLPGTSVQVTNTETGVTKTSVTDADGGYLVSDLVPGVYDVAFEISGFKRVLRRAVRVESNAVRRVDARLEVSIWKRRSKSSLLQSPFRPNAPTCTSRSQRERSTICH